MPWPFASTTPEQAVNKDLPRLSTVVQCYERAIYLLYGTTVRPQGDLSRVQIIQVTNTTPFTIANPLEPRDGAVVTLVIENSSGGVIAPTFGSEYRMHQQYFPPDNGLDNSISFVRTIRGFWQEIGRAYMAQAPVDAQYLVGAASAFLTAERLVVDTPTVSWDFSVANQAKANAILAPSHVLATTAALGPQHTVSGLTARQVLIATGATTALFRALVPADIPVLDHTADLSNVGTNTHAQIDTAISNSVAHIAASNPHSGSAPLASPAFTGTPTAPTQAAGNNTTRLATTAFVQGELASYALLTDLAPLAPKASPAFTGTPTAPTQAAGNNSTRLATTAFVQGELAAYALLTDLAPLAPKASPTFTGTITAAIANFSGLLTGSTGIVSGAGGASSKNTLGLTVNQGASDDEVATFQSSDVAHGMTTIADTDTFGTISKAAAASGGVALIGLSDTGGVNACFLGGYAGAVDTAKTTSADGAVEVRASKKSGTGLTAMGTNDNLFIITNNGAARFIFVDDGGYCDAAGAVWTAYDDHDDIELLNRLNAHLVAPTDPLRARFTEFLAMNREDLERMRLVVFNEDGHHFVNMTRLSMLLTGACRQIGKRQAELEARLVVLETKLLAA